MAGKLKLVYFRTTSAHNAKEMRPLISQMPQRSFSINRGNPIKNSRRCKRSGCKVRQRNGKVVRRLFHKNDNENMESRRQRLRTKVKQRKKGETISFISNRELRKCFLILSYLHKCLPQGLYLVTLQNVSNSITAHRTRTRKFVAFL